MRILIVGAGGVGGYFGARLAAVGHDVVFMARGAHLAAIREHGLHVESALGNMHLKQVRVTDTPEDAGEVDLVFFGVKLWDTEATARSVATQLGDQTAVVSFQNSVVKDDILRDILGADHVMGGVCYIASTVAEPGLIQHSGIMQKLVFGEYDGRESVRALRLRDACVQAGIDVELSHDIQRAIWEKFVFLSAFSGITSAVRAPIGPIRANEQARAFLYDAMDEAVQVARAEGVAIPADYAKDRMAFADQLPASMTSSMYHDLERGNRIELAWLSGDVLARGERLGVPTPCSRAIVALLSIYGNGSAG